MKPKKIFALVLIAASLASLFLVPWMLVKAWILPLPKTIQEQVDEAISFGFDGMIVHIDQAGEPPKYYTGGWHNRATKNPAKPNTLFKIASISKLYDAVAVTKLVNANQLSLTKPIAAYLPNLVGKIAHAETITLKNLVQHRSGIPNFTDTPNFWASPTNTYEESLALIANKPANFSPGEDYEYCNTNYLLINKILDTVLGDSNFTYKQEQILKPLRLQNTFASIKAVDMERVMSGYHIGHPLDLKTDDLGMVATAKDVAIFLRALNDGTLMSKKEQKIYDELYKYEHAGWVPGYQSFAQYHKELDAVIVTFYSTTDPKLYYWNLSEIINNRIAKILSQKNK